MNPDDVVADFDSAMTMLRAVACTLRSKGLPAMGTRLTNVRLLIAPASHVLDRLPARARELLFIRAGRSEAISPRNVGRVHAERIARWVVSMYPRRSYPAVAIGSSNGALTHLWAAMGIPWLPQTLLVPVRRRGIDVDDAVDQMAWGAEHAPVLLARNPELVLHHMSDPVQDRLMLHAMAYFRLKRIALGEAWERFLASRLAPGATIFIVDCRLTWDTARVGPRHVFQHGALGGATEAEYRDGGPRVASFLQEHHAHASAWHPPQVDGRSPEAEWGFDGDLVDEIRRLVVRRRLRVVRISFEQPEAASPFVADIFARWYEMRRETSKRLFVSSFVLLDPYWTLRARAIPFWMVFNSQTSAEALEEFLSRRARFERVDMTLFSHGVQSIGLAPLQRWAALESTAHNGGALLGVSPRAFPSDFGNFVRYHGEMVRSLDPRWPLPTQLGVIELERLIDISPEAHRICYQEE